MELHVPGNTAQHWLSLLETGAENRQTCVCHSDSSSGNSTSDAQTGAPDASCDALQRLRSPADAVHLSLRHMRCIRRRCQQNAADSGDSASALPSVHQMIACGRLVLPSPPEPVRSAELEKRCERLRQQQNEREYQKLVRNVSRKSALSDEPSIAAQLREVNAQLVEVGQLVISVIAAFMFGYFAAVFAAGYSDTASRILMGLLSAGVVFVAEAYFLVRYLNRVDGK